MVKKTFLPVISIILMITPLFSAQPFYKQGFSTQQIRLGFDVAFFERTITWGEDQNETSSMKNLMFLLKPGYELMEGTRISAVLGYSLSNFDEMIFRKLPFSLELNTGNIDGVVLGGEAEVRIGNFSRFTLSATGQFIYYLGFKEDWEIPGLNVEGTATGNPSWAQLTAGPNFSFHVNDYLRPYLAVYYDILWGKFKMNQKIEELSGEQEMKIESKSNLNLSIGTLYEIIDRVDLKAEATLLPLEEQIGLKLLIGVMVSF
jgi:hypothetical protein